MRGKSRREFLKFVAVGGVSFLVHNFIYLFLTHFAVNATLAYSAGYVSWAITNFLLSNYITFHTRPTFKSAVGFVVSACLYYLIQLVGFTLCRWLAVPDVIITPLVYTIAFPANFFMVRYVFRRWA